MGQTKHFAMIRSFHLADLFTLSNAGCGVGGIFEAMSYLMTQETRHLAIACALIPAALVFDVLDGKIARWRQKTSAMGQELDSLADVISFGVAPAALAYGVGMNGLWDRVVLLYFVLCGVSRLARYNIIATERSAEGARVTDFEGTPIPTSVVLVLVLAAAVARGAIGDQLWLGVIHFGPGRLHPLVLIFALSGSLMISRSLRIRKF